MPAIRIRIACLKVPDFPIAAHLRADATARCDGPAIVAQGEGKTARVEAASPEARKLGIRRGMRAADARGLSAGLREWPWSPALYDATQMELAAALLAASPRVSRAGPGAFWLDARGWDRRGGESAFVDAARVAALATGYPEARIGVADTAAAARAATRLRGRKVCQVASGGDARFLATLPIGVLPISDELAALLDALGLETVGEFAELEPAEVEARLGSEGARAHSWARGLDDGRETLGPGAAESDWTASVELPGPVETLEPVLFILKSCLDHLSGALELESLCVQTLRLTLETEEGPSERTLRPARPTRGVALLLSLCRNALEGERLAGRALGVRIEAIEVTPSVAEQADLFEAPRPDPDALALALVRLQGRWGRESVVRPTPAASHRPEKEGRWEPVELMLELRRQPERHPTLDIQHPRSNGSRLNDGEALTGFIGEASLVLRLWPRPRPLEVRIEDGRPGALTLDGTWCKVSLFGGPERLSGEWWEDPFSREYYRVSTERGDLLWVYYDPQPRAWYWHGWWD